MNLLNPRCFLTLVGLALTAGSVVGTVPASAAPSRPAVNRPAGAQAATPIEPLAQYVPQTSCDPHLHAGTIKLGNRLLHFFPRSTYQGAYACATDGSVSEHYEGRAIDWMVNQHNAVQRAYGKAALKWLFATDRSGNTLANARRLGIMYIVYNNRIWGSWDAKWHPYNGCAKTPQAAYDNSCHRTHMHLSLSWEGALGQTSYWTGSVARTDYGPCIGNGLNWAPTRKVARATPCARTTRLAASKNSSAIYKALVPYSGARVRYGDTGPVVSAVQRGVGVPVTGRFGAATRTAVKTFQARHHLPTSGKALIATWRALLAANK